MAAENVLLEVRGVSKQFGGFQATQSVSLSVRPGEAVGLLGDNGAGKSTLIKILSGVHQPDSGEIWFRGERVSLRSPAVARRLGIETVHQNLGLVDELTVARNFFLGAELKRNVGPVPVLDLPEMERQTQHYLRELGIAAYAVGRERVKYLSGGERQAIAIARAMYFGARMIVLDEPTSALSVKETRKVLGYVREACSRDLGVLLVSHNLKHVIDVADRIVVMYHGAVALEVDREHFDHDELEETIMEGRQRASQAASNK